MKLETLNPEHLAQQSNDELESIVVAIALELFCREHPTFQVRNFLRTPLGNAIAVQFYRGKLLESQVMRWYHARWEQI